MRKIITSKKTLRKKMLLEVATSCSSVIPLCLIINPL